MRSGLFILAIFAAIGCSPLAAQITSTSGTKIVKWQTIDSKGEFSVAMPEGTTGFTEDNEYTLGNERHRVTKRIFVYHYLNGTALLTELFEGDVKGVRDELVSRITGPRTAYELANERDFGDFNIRSYVKREEKYHRTQQFILFKKRLYVLQAHANSDDISILQQYIRSVSIPQRGKVLLPNLSEGANEQSALKPPDITVRIHDATGDMPLLEKPDRDVIMLYRPLPKYSEEARRRQASGEVRLKVLFLASGKIGKIEVESGEISLRDGAIAAAERTLFIPAEKNGKAVSVWKQIQYSFAVR